MSILEHENLIIFLFVLYVLNYLNYLENNNIYSNEFRNGIRITQIYVHKDEIFKWKCNLFHYNYFSLVLR